MAFNRPSMPELVERVTTDIESRLPGSDARLRRSNLNVLARVIAAVAHGLYGFIAWVARQVIPDTAELEHLERWAAVWGITRTAATPAVGNVVFTGTTGTVIPAGTLMQRGDGVEFRTSAQTSIAGGTVTTAVAGQLAGADGNTAVASRLVLAAQILGVNATATVAAGGVVGGTDIEGDDSLRERLLFRIRKPPLGGAQHDYEAWAREVAGVTRVWVYPLLMGAGSVGVFFVRDGDASIFPDVAAVAAVAAHIEPLRPVTAKVFVMAPAPLPVNITLRVAPDTSAVRAAVAAELADLFRREAAPGATLLLTHLGEAVSLASGEVTHLITAPTTDVVAGPGQIPALGNITWI